MTIPRCMLEVNHQLLRVLIQSDLTIVFKPLDKANRNIGTQSSIQTRAMCRTRDCRTRLDISCRIPFLHVLILERAIGYVA